MRVPLPVFVNDTEPAGEVPGGGRGVATGFGGVNTGASVLTFGGPVPTTGSSAKRCVSPLTLSTDIAEAVTRAVPLVAVTIKKNESLAPLKPGEPKTASSKYFRFDRLLG